jgi:hypothetical protein
MRCQVFSPIANWSNSSTTQKTRNVLVRLCQNSTQPFANLVSQTQRDKTNISNLPRYQFQIETPVISKFRFISGSLVTQLSISLQPFLEPQLSSTEFTRHEINLQPLVLASCNHGESSQPWRTQIYPFNSRSYSNFLLSESSPALSDLQL